MKVLKVVTVIALVGLLLVWFREWAMMHPLRAVAVILAGLVASQKL